MLDDVEQKLLAAATSRRAALLEDLRRHVGIPTGANHRDGLVETAELLTRRLAALGAVVERHDAGDRPEWLYGSSDGEPAWKPQTIVCRRRDASHAPAVLLSGHLDTVHDPAGSFRELAVAPDAATATGPGCVDMKGGLVIAVAALEILEECRTSSSAAPAWGFVLNSDEETGSYWSEATLRAEAGRGYIAGLVLEPALPDGSLVIERPGSGQFMLDVSGRAAHVGRDFKSGISAVNDLARALLDINGLARPDDGVIVNVGPLEGGHATNVVPDRARAWGNVRFPLPADGAALEASLRAIAAAQGPGPLPSRRIHTSFNRPAKPATPAVMQLAAHARAVSEDLRRPLPFGKTGGVCDGNILQDAGLPTIDTLGVRGGGLHTPQEWIALESLVERTAMLAILIHRLTTRAT